MSTQDESRSSGATPRPLGSLKDFLEDGIQAKNKQVKGDLLGA